MCRGKSFQLTVIVLFIVSIANAGLVLTVNGLDTSMPVDLDVNEKIVIAVESNDKVIDANCKITASEGELIQISEPNEAKEYLLELPFGNSLAIVDLHSVTEHLYQLAVFHIADQNTTTVFGIGKEMLDVMYAKQHISKAAATEIIQESIMDDSEGGMAMTMAGYDLVFSGVNQFSSIQSYSNQSILVLEDGIVVYEKGATFENCTVDVNGFIELSLDVNLVDSNIVVLGGLEVEPGTVINETGASSIIANGDSFNAGRIILEGEYANPIRVYSDYAPTDAEFIIIEPESSSNSTIKWVDFFGGWTNIQIYDKRLNEGISNCRFFAPNYGVYQNGIDELTDVKFCLFYWNTISVYLEIDDCSANEVEFLLDNVVIDNNFENPSYGIILSGFQTVPDYSTLRIQNSIITNTYCGWFIDFDTSFYPPVMSNLAYYGNGYDDNLSDSSFQKYPMYLAQNPFVTPSDPNGWPYFIDPNSEVADVNISNLWQSSPQQLLTSIYEDGTPRGNKGIGFGMPIPLSYATKRGEIACDILSDGIVNYKDFAEFAGNWGFSGISLADFDDDGVVNVNDLDILSENWLNNSYIEPNIIENGDYLTLTCNEANDVNLGDFAFFIDGKYVASRDIVDYPELLIDKRRYKNGIYNIKAVAKGDNSQPYVTAAKLVSFESPLSGITYPELFDPCNYFVLNGNVMNGYTATISIKDMDNNVLWSSDFSDDFTTLVDPNCFSDEINYTVNFSYDLTPPADPPPAAPLTSSSGSGSALALGGKPTNKTAGLILCTIANGMTEGAGYTDTGTCRYAARMWKDNGVKAITLLGFGEHSQVNFEMFKKVFSKYRNIRYLHINAHGEYETDGAGFFGFDVPRTRFRFNDGDWPAYNSRIWTDRGLDVPEHYEWLSDSMEEHYCLGHFPFKYDQLRIVVLEPCYALRNIATRDGDGVVNYVDGAYEWEVDHNQNAHYQYPYSDVCFAFNVLSSKQMMLGSGERVVKGSIYPYFARFINAFWYGLGEENLNVYNALMDWAIPNANMDVLDEYRTRGAGVFTDIYLNTNP